MQHAVCVCAGGWEGWPGPKREELGSSLSPPLSNLVVVVKSLNFCSVKWEPMLCIPYRVGIFVLFCFVLFCLGKVNENMYLVAFGSG